MFVKMSTWLDAKYLRTTLTGGRIFCKERGQKPPCLSGAVTLLLARSNVLFVWKTLKYSVNTP